MTYDSDYLFVYGTLRPSFTNPFAHFLRQHSEYVGEGAFPGELFDLGNYPGALYSPAAPSKVYGSIYSLASAKEMILKQLDDYEGIGENYAKPHEYVRIVVPVAVAQQLITCWVYVYNWPTSTKKRIDTGDYCQYRNS